MTIRELLTTVQRTRTDDGKVHLPLRDGTTATGWLVGCTRSAVYLHNRSTPIPLRDLQVS